MQPSALATINRIVEIIDGEKRAITNRELLAICAEHDESYLADPHLGHEIAEAALNLLVATKYAKVLLHSTRPASACAEILRPLQKRLPTQTWRSTTQLTYQQFSTPVAIAYLAAYLLNLSGNDNVLEPSCGTGSLAVWALGSGAEVATNEIDFGRRELAVLLGLNPTGYNAEFIDDLLPEDFTPNVVLANPPFSSSAGRTTQNQSKFGFRHVESALRRLAKGGRFAIILGESGSPRSAQGKAFWESLQPDIRVTASIDLPGHEYYRNGTTVGVTLILGEKSSGTTDRINLDEKPVGIAASSVEDAFDQALALGLRFSSLSQ
jgi:type I restriction-modification system DNA methylase subunit